MISHNTLQRNLKDLSCPFPDTREGAYSFFAKIIIEQNCLNLGNKRYLLRNLLTENFLFKGIEKGVSDETCARSFSLLVINLIIASDTDFELNLSKVYEALKLYIEKETDFRDFDRNLGWIHTAAHFSDLLTTLAWHKNRDNSKNRDLARVLYQKIYPDIYFSYGKADRLRISDVWNRTIKMNIESIPN